MATIPGANFSASGCHWFTRDNGATIWKGPEFTMPQDGKAGPGNPCIGYFPLILMTKKRTIHEVRNKTSQVFTLTL